MGEMSLMFLLLVAVIVVLLLVVVAVLCAGFVGGVYAALACWRHLEGRGEGEVRRKVAAAVAEANGRVRMLARRHAGMILAARGLGPAPRPGEGEAGGEEVRDRELEAVMGSVWGKGRKEG